MGSISHHSLSLDLSSLNCEGLREGRRTAPSELGNKWPVLVLATAYRAGQTHVEINLINPKE
eukprot:2046568-Amphidinium_carterae.2